MWMTLPWHASPSSTVSRPGTPDPLWLLMRLDILLAPSGRWVMDSCSTPLDDLCCGTGQSLSHYLPRLSKTCASAFLGWLQRRGRSDRVVDGPDHNWLVGCALRGFDTSCQLLKV